MRKRHESRDEAGKNLEETTKNTLDVTSGNEDKEEPNQKKQHGKAWFNLQGMNICAKTVTASY